MDVRTDRRDKIPLCVLQDIGPFGPLLKMAGNMATLVVCGWAVAVKEKVTRAIGQKG